MSPVDQHLFAYALPPLRKGVGARNIAHKMCLWSVRTAHATAIVLAATSVGNAQQTAPTAGNATVQPAVTPVNVDTAIPAIPSAQEVIVDLPSARHASRYQVGEINGLRYVLYSDGTGKVMQNTGRREVLHRLECPDTSSCVISSTSGNTQTSAAKRSPKPVVPAAPDGGELAQYLAEWVLSENADEFEVATLEPALEPEPQVPVEVPAPTENTTDRETDATALIETADTPETATPETTTPTSVETAIAKAAPQVAKVKAPAVKRQQIKRTATAKRSVRKRAPAPSTVARSAALPVEAPKPPQTIFQRLQLNCSISGSVVLRYKKHNDTQVFGKPKASLGCGMRLSKKLTLRVTAIGFLDSNTKSSSDAEFTYALTYRATKKLTFSYSNYSGRFSDSSSAFVDSLTSGSLRASYRLPKIKLPNDKAIGCSAGIGIAKPEDTRANLSCSYAVTRKLRIGASAYAYFSGKQENTDADFSYTASYRINDDWSINYSNYTNNRFFWNESSNPGDGILGGTLSVSYKFKF